MKKITFFSAFVLIFLSSYLSAQKQVFTYQFDKPQLKASSDGYTDISYKNCINMGKEGTPLLPQFSANLLLPPGTEISSVKVTGVEYYTEENGIAIRPASRQFPISIGAPKGYRAVPDQKIYSSDAAYPSEKTSAIYTGFLSGHAMGSFHICPVVYFPSLLKAKFIKSVTIEVSEKTTEQATRALDMLRSNKSVNDRIISIAQHHDFLQTYNAMAKRDDPTYDILLITKNSFLPYFNDYIAYKQSTGYAVICKTVEDIYSQYTGTDNPMKIRNCIIDLYQNNGIGYVILAGDADPNSATDNIVPKRGFYADPGSGYADNDIPSDMYYGCLDGTWNNNNNNKWGESGEEDLYHEVSVGRLCVDSPSEIQNILNKLTLYQSSPVIADINKGLMVGEQLDSQTYGDTYKEEVANGATSNGYTTAGFPESFDISRLYESQGNWEKENIFNKFNTGTHLLNHLGHSNVDYNMKMYNTDVTTTNFQNNGINHGFVIGYSQGCYNGSFDNRSDGGNFGTEDCFAEKITTLATGEVACISNSRYGWYSGGSTNGASQFFDREFFDALFGENIYNIGDINADSKDDNASNITSDEVIKWCGYETNLFGDPSMDIWTATPSEITATYQQSISVGVNQIDFQTDVPFARIGLMQNDSLIGRGVADANGNATITLNGPITNVADPISVSIIGHNRIRHQGTIVVIANQPYIMYQAHQIKDNQGNNNNQLDPGEAVGLNVSLKNVGTQPASNVIAKLISSDDYINITDSTENYGNFAAGQTISLDAFGMAVSDSIADQHKINFNLNITGDTTWNSHFSIIANAPVLSVGSLSINDGQGGNGRLDPGETVVLSIATSNLGHSNASNTISNITTNSPYVTINSSSFSLDTLSVNETATATFNLTISANAPIGAIADINYTVTSEGYTAHKTFGPKIGLVLEDFESNNFTHFSWTQGGNQPWTITNVDPYEGVYSAKSGAIGNSQKSQLSLVMNVAVADSISFYLKTSSESGWDYLKFYIDATMINKWSGETPWTKVSFPVATGSHTFKWEYMKDNSQASGSDCAWLDYIIFPAAVPPSGFSVSGAITYANTNNTPLNGLTVNLKNAGGNIVGTSTTNATGNYAFTAIPAGNYTLGVATNKIWDGVTATDVLLYRKHVANVSMLSGIYLASGDVNASGSLSAADILLIRKRIAFVTNSFQTGDWLFNNMPIVVGSSNITQNFNGIVYGDANGSYIPTETKSTLAQQGLMNLGTVDATKGDVVVPIHVSDIQNMGSFQFTVQYDATKLQLADVTNWFAGINDVTIGSPAPGYITFVWAADVNGINISDDVLCNIHFTSNSVDGSALSFVSNPTKIEFSDYEGNLFTPEFANGSVGSVTGIGELSQNGLNIYPNPSNGKFTLLVNHAEKVNVKVVNSLGKVVFEQTYSGTQNNYNLNLQNQPKGYYLMTVTTDKNCISKTIIVQ
jgi:hypothetical protein